MRAWFKGIFKINKHKCLTQSFCNFDGSASLEAHSVWWNDFQGSEARVSTGFTKSSSEICQHEYKLDEEIGILCRRCGYVSTEIRDVAAPFVSLELMNANSLFLDKPALDGGRMYVFDIWYPSSAKFAEHPGEKTFSIVKDPRMWCIIWFAGSENVHKCLWVALITFIHDQKLSRK